MATTEQDGFVFVDFGHYKGRRKAKAREAIVVNNLDSNDYRITFNQEVTESLAQKQLKFISIREDRITGQIWFYFSNDPNKLSVRMPKAGNAVVTCKQLVHYIADFMGWKKGEAFRERIAISGDLSKDDTIALFAIEPPKNDPTPRTNLFD